MSSIQDTASGPVQKVVLVDPISGQSDSAVPSEAKFNRPANTTPYVADRLVANSTVAASVAPMAIQVLSAQGGLCRFSRAKLTKTSVNLSNAVFRLHLFTALPVVANGDNGVFSVTGVKDYIGAFDVVVDTAFVDGSCGFGLPVVGLDQYSRILSGTIIYVLIQAKAAYTPTSGEEFDVSFDVV